MFDLINFFADKNKTTVQTTIQKERIDDFENAIYIYFPMKKKPTKVSFSRIFLENELEEVFEKVQSKDVFIRAFSDSVVIKIIKRGLVNVRIENLIFYFDNCKIRINGLYKRKPLAS